MSSPSSLIGIVVSGPLPIELMLKILFCSNPFRRRELLGDLGVNHPLADLCLFGEKARFLEKTAATRFVPLSFSTNRVEGKASSSSDVVESAEVELELESDEDVDVRLSRDACRAISASVSGLDGGLPESLKNELVEVSERGSAGAEVPNCSCRS